MAALNRLNDGVCEISIQIPWNDINNAYESVVENSVKKAEVPGFRQGKAPRKIVEKNLDKSKVYEEVIRELIPKVYDQAVKDLNLRPIMIPKIELAEAREGKDWTVIARTCEKPEIQLNGYKEKVSELNAGKRKKIWLPGEEKEEKQDQSNKPSLDEILQVIAETVKIPLPSILVEEEVNRMLSDLIDQTKKLGLSVDQYLASTNRTSESIRTEYEKQAIKTLTLEFALETIAEKETITVSDDDITKAIDQAKTDADKVALSKQKYYLASILRRRKTLDFLASL